MKWIAVSISMLIGIVACSSEPASPSGSLPVVQNLRVNETETKGDTVVLEWDALTVQVDGYHVYWSSSSPGTWHEYVVNDTTVTEIAETTRYYYVKASRGLDYSSGNSNQVDTKGTYIYGPFILTAGSSSNGILFYEDAAGVATGVADSSEFAQDIYIDMVNSQLYFFSGDHNSVEYPGGNHTPLCPVTTSIAPDPGSSVWVDSVLVTSSSYYYGHLSNDHYIQFYVDSVFSDGAYISSVNYQTIAGLRLLP
ncbi:MAG: hypothetical protein GQ565_11960 [Candidatus Aegiribacteria sp.]|nr:hypothetical protein [Candidatus Aegiribacteria sp.]